MTKTRLSDKQLVSEVLSGHPATTYIDGQYFVWSLFVPERALPPPEQFFGYTFQYWKGIQETSSRESTKHGHSWLICHQI